MDKIKEIVKVAYDALDDKLAEDVKVLDISGVSVMADYFLIATGKNPNHVKTLVDFVEEKVNKAGFDTKNIEGTHSGSWVLLDFSDIIVHIFDKENRSFYDLERIWADGKVIEDVKDL